MTQPSLQSVPSVAPIPLAALPGGGGQQAMVAFDALAPGESVTLTLDRAPGDLLAWFRSERGGQFDWTPTRDGPAVWEVEVSRRDAPRGDQRSVNEALAWDHDRLDSLEAGAFAAREQGDAALAARLYSKFAFGLRRHIRFEEELLFPEFELRSGIPAATGPTAVMRAEHREILDWLARIEAVIGDLRSDPNPLRSAFHAVLGDHNLKEEHVVYPGTDRALTAEERDELVARIQAL